MREALTILQDQSPGIEFYMLSPNLNPFFASCILLLHTFKSRAFVFSPPKGLKKL